MNKRQWNVFGIFSVLLGILFVNISLQWKRHCGLDEVTMANIFSCTRGEIFSPFPYIFFILAVVFFICGLLEAKSNQ